MFKLVPHSQPVHSEKPAESGKLTSQSQTVQLKKKKREASDEEGAFSTSVSLVDRHDESSSSSSSKGKRPEKPPKKTKKPKAPTYNVAPYSKGGGRFGSFACRVDVDERSPEASVIKSDAKIALRDHTRRKYKVKTDRSYSGKLKIEFILKSSMSSRSNAPQKIDGAMKSLVTNCAFKPMSCGGVTVSGGPKKYLIHWTVNNVKAGSDMANAVQAMIDNHFRDRYDPGTRPKERSKIRERCPKDTLQGDYIYWIQNGDKAATAKESEQAINRICDNANRLVQQGYDAQELAKMHFLAERDVETAKSLPHRPDAVKLSAWFGYDGRGAHLANLTPQLAEVIADVATHVMKDAAPSLGIQDPTAFNVGKLDWILRSNFGPGTIVRLSKPSIEHYVLHRSLVAIIVEEIRKGVFAKRSLDEIAEDVDGLRAAVGERFFARHVRNSKATETAAVDLSVEQSSFEVDG